MELPTTMKSVHGLSHLPFMSITRGESIENGGLYVRGGESPNCKLGQHARQIFFVFIRFGIHPTSKHVPVCLSEIPSTPQVHLASQFGPDKYDPRTYK